MQNLQLISQVGIPTYWDANGIYQALYLKKLLEDPSLSANISHEQGKILTTIQEVTTFVKDNKGRLFYKNTNANYQTYNYQFNNGYISFNHDPEDNTVEVEFVSLDEETSNLFETFKTNFISKDEKGLIYALVEKGNALSTEVIGQEDMVLLLRTILMKLF